MCLVFVGVEAHKSLPLVVAFNRDEVFWRPTRAAHWWDDSPGILAGRDLERGGTWAGVTREGRMAMLTFVRTANSGTGERSRRSRGQIVREFLISTDSPEPFLEAIEAAGDAYLPFNLILGDVENGLRHYNSLDRRITVLGRGVHGLSNATLDTPWPKVVRGKTVLGEWLASGADDVEPVFALMSERGRFTDPELPETGVSQERERALSSLFVEEEDYGTRTTTVVLLDRTGRMQLFERTHATSANPPSEIRFEWTREQS